MMIFRVLNIFIKNYIKASSTLFGGNGNIAKIPNFPFSSYEYRNFNHLPKKPALAKWVNSNYYRALSGLHA